MGNVEGFNKQEVPTNRAKSQTPRAQSEKLLLGPGGLEVKEKTQAAICCLCHSLCLNTAHPLGNLSHGASRTPGRAALIFRKKYS